MSRPLEARPIERTYVHSARAISFPQITIQGAVSPRMAKEILDFAISSWREMSVAEAGVEIERQAPLSDSDMACQVRWTPPLWASFFNGGETPLSAQCLSPEIQQPGFPQITIQGATSPRMAKTSLDVALSFMEEMCNAESGVEIERQVTVSYSDLTCQVRWTPPFGDLVVQWHL